MLKTYDYECPICGHVEERLVDERSKDEPAGCPVEKCLGVLARVEISGSSAFWMDRRYRMKAVMSDGSTKEGTFGETSFNPKLRTF